MKRRAARKRAAVTKQVQREIAVRLGGKAMSTAEKVKYTPGAIRAAKAIMAAWCLDANFHSPAEILQHYEDKVAAVIDAETAVPEMAEALRGLLEAIRFWFPDDPIFEIGSKNADVAKAEAALQKAGIL